MCSEETAVQSEHSLYNTSGVLWICTRVTEAPIAQLSHLLMPAKVELVWICLLTLLIIFSSVTQTDY